MTTTFTGYLQTNANGTVQVLASTWVKFVNNNTANAYVSSSASNSDGKYVMASLPAGTYTVSIGPTIGGPWTATGNTSYQVEPVEASGAGTIPGTLTVGIAGDQSVTANNILLSGATLSTIGSGDSVQARLGAPSNSAQILDIRKGTAGAPDTVGNPLMKISRTFDLNSGLEAGDGAYVAGGLDIEVTNTVDDVVQPLGLVANAKSISTAAQVGGLAADAGGVYATGWVSGAGIHVGIGGFFAGINDSTDVGAQRRISAIQLAAKNATTTDAVVNTSGFSGGAIWVNAGSSTQKVGAVLELGNSGGSGANPKAGLYDVGIHWTGQVANGNTGAIDTAGYQDDSSAATSILVKGTHATAAIAVKSGSGSTLLGGVSSITGSVALLEVQMANQSYNPLAFFGSISFNQPFRVRFQNTSGAASIAVASAGNNFLTGTLAGDTAIIVESTSKFWHVGGTVSALKVGNDNSVTFTSNPTLNAGLTIPAGQLATIGTGDNVVSRSGWPTSTPGLVDIRAGTAGSPDTRIGPMVKYSRTVQATTATEVSDGNYGSGVLEVESVGTLTHITPVTAIIGNAKTISTAVASAGLSADAAGVYGYGWASGTSTHVGMGGFFAGVNDSTAVGAQGLVNGLQVAVVNDTATDATAQVAGYSGGGILIWAASSFQKVATAIEIHNTGVLGHGAKAGLFDVGIHFNAVVSNGNTGAIDKASIQDDSHGSYSYLDQGVHGTASIAIAAGSGKVLIGGTSQLLAATLLEVQAPNSSVNPLVIFGNTAFTQAWRLLRGQNGAGALDWCVAAGANQFLTGTASGDTAFVVATSSKFWHMGGTISAIKIGNDNTITLQPTVATTAGGATMATLGNASLGVYVGSGVPTVSAPRGSLYLRTDGLPYFNTNATTGWNALMGDVGDWTASDHGFISWNQEPTEAGNTLALTPAGTVFVQRIHIRKPTTVTNIHLWMGAIGNTLTLNQCLAGFYDSAGNLLSATGDQSVRWVGALGLVTMALSVAQVVAAGDYYTAFFYNGTTGPTFNRTANTSLTNVNLAGSSLRFSTANTGQTTTMPALLSGYANVNAAYWVALS